ncbi:MAG: hypothetical protein GY838_12165 [bacterium]|nr:hypothetical protein [bacterium]
MITSDRMGAAALVFLMVAAPMTALADFPLDECPLGDENWVFCTAFEDGDFSVWDDYDGNPAPDNVLLEDPGPWNVAGNHVARLRVPAGRGGVDLIKVMPSTYDIMYARWYVQWEPGYDFSVLSHGGGIWAGDRNMLSRSGYRPDGTDRFGAGLEPYASNGRLNTYGYYRGMYQDCVDPEGLCWGDRFPCMLDEGQGYCTEPQHRDDATPPPVLESGRWYCIEMMFDAGTPSPDGSTADGVLNFWIDGVEQGPWDDLWLRTSADLKLSVLWLQLFHHDVHPVAGILLDNVVVSTAPIGCRADEVPADSQTWSGVKADYR